MDERSIHHDNGHGVAFLFTSRLDPPESIPSGLMTQQSKGPKHRSSFFLSAFSSSTTVNFVRGESEGWVMLKVIVIWKKGPTLDDGQCSGRKGESDSHEYLGSENFESWVDFRVVERIPRVVIYKFLMRHHVAQYSHISIGLDISSLSSNTVWSLATAWWTLIEVTDGLA